jgi:hypothetical protein
MALQFSVTARNNRLDSIETTIGTAAKLYIRAGTPPADCAAADTGTLLATLSLPPDWMNAAASGSKTKLGTWSVAASGSGVAGHFRIKDSAGTTTHLQGTAGMSSEDMVLDNSNIAATQVVTVNTFTLTDANA